MSLNLREFIAKQKKEHEDSIKELDHLVSLIEHKYPDLERTSDRWNNIRYKSVLVNSKVTDCEIHHTCGCCADAPLVLEPFLIEDGGVKIYSNPTGFYIGQKYECGYGEMASEGWEKQLIKNNIPEHIIQEVLKYFEENPCIDADDDDDES